MTGELTIRPARPGDRDATVELLREAGLPLAGFDSVAASFIAERDGGAIGVTALEHHSDANGDAFLLRSVAVRESARGQGVGAALTRVALRHVDACGGPVGLLTETAPGYFPRFGFRAVDRGALPTALAASRELQGACAVSARAFLRA